jgi:hypothetical protein
MIPGVPLMVARDDPRSANTARSASSTMLNLKHQTRELREIELAKQCRGMADVKLWHYASSPTLDSGSLVFLTGSQQQQPSLSSCARVQPS